MTERKERPVVRQNVRSIASMSALERYERMKDEEYQRGALDLLLEGETMASLREAAERERRECWLCARCGFEPHWRTTCLYCGAPQPPDWRPRVQP